MVSLVQRAQFPRASSGGVSFQLPSQSARSNINQRSYSRQLSAVEEYEWPDLPPVQEFKSAIARQRVSRGISYVLPMDKTKVSVENIFRTDLRLIFKDPYADDTDDNFNEGQLQSSMQHHFNTNTTTTEFDARKHDQPGKYAINAESQKILKNYSYSAPTTGLTGSKMNGNVKQRSMLFLPLSAKIPPEAQRLKEEADKILKSVEDKEEKETSEAANKPEIKPKKPENIKLMPMVGLTANRPRSPRGSVTTKSSGLNHSINRYKFNKTFIHRKTPVQEKYTPDIKQAKSFSFEELNSIKVPSKREIPGTAKSTYLSEEKNGEIWQWLHKGEAQTDLGYFLEVCS